MIDDENIVTLNYSTHFREWWMKHRTRLTPEYPAEDMRNEYAYDLLSEAQHFLLPTGGRLLDDLGRMDAKYAPLLKLPFPITAFEFFSEKRMDAGIRSSKRIALCVDSTASNKYQLLKLAEDEFFCMSLYYMDEFKIWNVYPALAILSRSRIGTFTKEHADRSGPIEEKMREAGIEPSRLAIGTQVVPILLKWLPSTEQYTTEDATVNTRDETVAAMQACAALSCKNICTKSMQPSAVLNEKRERSGKLPFIEYRVLNIAGETQARADHQGGTHASPRWHLRRGHIRHYADGTTTWVRSCVVGDSRNGVVLKDYQQSVTP